MNGPQLMFMSAALLGAVGMWLMLPPARTQTRLVGVLFAGVSLGLLVSALPPVRGWVNGMVFYILAGVTVVAAVATVTLRNPIYCAIWFGLTLLGTAGLYLFQGAQFLAVATVVVYAGAILVTFLFVLMLAQPQGRAPYDRTSWEAMVSAACGAVIVGILSMTVTSVLTRAGETNEATVAQRQEQEAALKRGVLADEHVASIGAELFGRHLIAVEVAGTLLLAALVGAAVIVGQSRGPVALPSVGHEDAPPGHTVGDLDLPPMACRASDRSSSGDGGQPPSETPPTRDA